MKISSTLAVMVLTLGNDGRLRRGRCSRRRRQEHGCPAPSVAPRAFAAPPAADASPAAASQPVMPATPGATLPAKPAMPATAPPAPSGMPRAGSVRSRASPPAWGLPRCCRISACRREWSFLLLALLAIGVVFVRAPPVRASGAAASPSPIPAPPAPPPRPRSRSRRPRNGAARQRIEPVLGATGIAPVSRISLPPGFDAAGFVKHAQQQFVRASGSARRRRSRRVAGCAHPRDVFGSRA